MLCSCLSRFLAFGFLLFGLAPQVLSADGNPIALRCWPDGGFSIETMWNLHLGLDISKEVEGQLPRMPDQAVSMDQSVDSVLSRTANEAEPKWRAASEVSQRDSNSVSVKTFPDSGRVVLVEVDGVRMLFVAEVAGNALPSVDNVDVLILGGAESAIATATIQQWASTLKPHVVVFRGDSKNAEKVAELTTALGTKTPFEVAHNTLAISSARKAEELQLVILKNIAWEMPQPLADLFERMESSCSDSQKVFAELSVNQMNFKPSNGTHTPRWNTEHMMGRQLLFFSQIYHAQDERIPVIDLNPKQMPPDYRFAHPDWDGREEARQMQRVSSFTRRFAYLLENVDVDEKAPGSSWPTLRALLNQMYRHYTEHTENTVKKFDLLDWPKE